MGSRRASARTGTQVFTASTVAAGLAAVGFVLLEPDLSAHVNWLSPAVSVSTFVILSAVAIVGATDTWVRADRRALPMAAAALASGILWLAGVASPSDPQLTAALLILAHTGTPVILLVAFLVSNSSRLAHPARAVGLVLSSAATGACCLIFVTVVSAPHLPVLGAADHYSTVGRLAMAASVVPLALALIAVTYKEGDRTRDPIVGVWILLLFESAASVGLEHIDAAGWVVLDVLRAVAFALIAFGEMRLFAISAQGERRRAEDLELLYAATTRIGSCLEPVQVARSLAEIVEAVVTEPAGRPAQIRVLQVDGTHVSVLTREAAADGGPSAGVADSFSLDLNPLLRSAVESGEPAFEARPVPRLIVPMVSGGTTLGAVEVTSRSPSPSWNSPDTLALIQGFTSLAALALANAEIFDDLQAAEAYNRAVLMAINDALISITFDGVIVGWNEHATDLLGWARASVLGRDLIDTIVPENRRAEARNGIGRFGEPGAMINMRDPAEFVMLHADGSSVPVEINLWRVESGASSRFCILVRDISARKQAEENLTRRATHDPLTQLPNRELLLDLLADELVVGKACEGLIGVIFIDLDHFKSVNDTHGHLVGDRLLTSVAARLRRGVRPTDVVGRLSGDEFLVICRNLSDPAEVESVANRLRRALSDPIGVEGTQVTVSASMGSAVGTAGSVTAKELIRRADEAMYIDKHAPRPELISAAGLDRRAG